ncbi:transcription elongation factor GreA [candidate division WWE3 bacterium]|uniref:Transcription elongation factor GreA n=1 Tax=candidate division WWE3 bacterium TaxID=2053526 RepID=A0A955LGV1_UNCKA|nr:transcription elongation factor GreA [candidate division WWE3 bacterium]
MKKDNVRLTQQGYDDIQNELDQLKVQRPQVIKDMDHMRSLGDLKENNAYEEKRRELGFLEGRIMELEEVLKNATIIEVSTGDIIALGSSVELHIEGDKVRYQIVDENEADIVSGKISSNSPIGKALFGKKVGDEVQVESPSGTITYQILGVE